MICSRFILVFGCLTFAHGAAFGLPHDAQPKRPADSIENQCEWYLTSPAGHVRDFLEKSKFDLSIPHRKMSFSDFKKLSGQNFRETDHGNFVDFPGLSYKTVRIDRSTFHIGDGSLEAELLKRSDVDGNPIEMNSFRAIKNSESDVHSETVDSNVFVKGINIPGKGMTVPAKDLGDAISSFINNLVSNGRGKGFVALEVLHVHPIYELVFKEGPNPFVIFPPSEPDLDFALTLSRNQPRVVILFTVLVPNGYSYTVALLNGKNVTEEVLNSPAE